jgi:MSHA pilin protein MshA
MRAARGQRGFSLTEIVVVCMILAILAAFAVPRLAAIESDKRAEAREELGRTIRSAAALSHALWLAQSRPVNVVMENGRFIAMVNGYPSAAAIDDALDDFTGYTYSEAGEIGTFTRAAGPACTVTYLEAPDNGVPTISVTGGLC